jgi:Na+-driven multidrug efflux pump
MLASTSCSILRSFQKSFGVLTQYFLAFNFTIFPFDFCLVCVFLIIEKMGEISLAVSNIVRSIYIILMIPIWGFASATNTFVSQYIGKGMSGMVVMLVKKVIRITMVAVVALSVLMLIFSEDVVKVYTNDERK